MSKNLRKQMPCLLFISQIKCSKTKKALLKYMSKSPNICSAFREIAHNIIKGNVKMSSVNKKRLIRHKGLIRNIAKAKNKKVVIQSGGWLWLIPAISAIIDIVK